MSKIDICQACQLEQAGAKTRIAVPHTCELAEPMEPIKEPKDGLGCSCWRGAAYKQKFCNNQCEW